MSKLSATFILSIIKMKYSRLVYESVNEDGSKAGKWHIKDLKSYSNDEPAGSIGDFSDNR